MQRQKTPRASALPADLVSPQAKLVYLYLATTGEATLDELTATLSMKKLAVLSVLRSLSDDGLVRQEGDRFALRR